MLRSLAIVAFVSAISCKGAEAPAGPTRTVQLSLKGADCAECAAKVRDELAKTTPVRGFAFDKKRVVITLTVDASTTDDVVLAAAKRAGLEAELGGEGGSYLRDPAPPPGADIAVAVDDGRDVEDLASVAVAGKVTVVDFFAGWCGPCRKVDAHLKKKLEGRTDLAYRRLDIVDWDTPLAKHWMNGVPELPYVIVFDKQKNKVDSIVGLDLARLDAAIAKAGAP